MPNADLFKRGIFIRIRNRQTVDIKFNPEDIAQETTAYVEHTHCDEVSSPLPLREASMTAINAVLSALGLRRMSSPSLEAFMQNNNLGESLTIDKQRTTYQDGRIHLDLDKVKDLGTYLEIEQMTDESGNRDLILQEMHRHLKGLSLRHVNVGYNELYWRKHDFNIYLQGKYLLAEDYEQYRAPRLAA